MVQLRQKLGDHSEYRHMDKEYIGDANLEIFNLVKPDFKLI